MEQVDAVVVRLEKNVERQIATVNSAVKGVAAERDLLSTAETARDLLLKAAPWLYSYLNLYATLILMTITRMMIIMMIIMMIMIMKRIE